MVIPWVGGWVFLVALGFEQPGNWTGMAGICLWQVETSSPLVDRAVCKTELEELECLRCFERVENECENCDLTEPIFSGVSPLGDTKGG